MAFCANKTPFFKQIATRSFAAQAKPKTAAGDALVKCNQLPNKLIVATANSRLPISRVSIVFRAGSRFEKYDNMGASHMLRVCAGLSTKNSTGFAITRNIQQCGGNLYVTSDREIIQYTVETTNDNLQTGLNFLKDVATAPAFKPWEINSTADRIRVQIASLPKVVRAVELLHKAAFRGGLGNSIYCPKYHIGKLSSETLQHFFNQTCTSNRCTVIGIGVDQNLLSGFAQNLKLESGDGAAATPPKFIGNVEIRKDRSSDRAHVAIAGQSAGLCNMKDALTYSVLKHALGCDPKVKYGNAVGPFGKIAAGNSKVSIGALNAIYQETGLFGVVLSCNAKDAKKIVEQAFAILKSGSVSAEDTKRGKALLKSHLTNLQDNESMLSAHLGYQAALTCEMHTAADFNTIIDSITEADVSNALKNLATSSFSMGAVGHLENVPSILDLNAK